MLSFESTHVSKRDLDSKSEAKVAFTEVAL